MANSDPSDSATPPSSLDLTGEMNKLETKEPPSLPDTQNKPIAAMQEETRGKLARTLLHTYQAIVVMVAIQIIYGYVALFSTDANIRDQKMVENQNQYVKELITLVLTSATGILGTAIGFYFGKQDSK
jgi:cell division protein FtsL